MADYETIKLDIAASAATHMAGQLISGRAGQAPVLGPKGPVEAQHVAMCINRQQQ